MTFLAGYHKENIQKAVMTPEVYSVLGPMLAPSRQRDLLKQLDVVDPKMMSAEAIEEAKKTWKALEVIFDKLESVTSMTIDGVYLPGDKECMASITASYTNFKVFDYLTYMTEPIRMKFH